MDMIAEKCEHIKTDFYNYFDSKYFPVYRSFWHAFKEISRP